MPHESPHSLHNWMPHPYITFLQIMVQVNLNEDVYELETLDAESQR
jgi:hypothetical protein